MKVLRLFCHLITLLLYLCNMFVIIDCGKTRYIYLPQGILRGTVKTSENYTAYYGVPYASVIKRFQDAGPAPKWDGIFVAKRRSIMCNQYSTIKKKPVGQEDCLVSNIFTPVYNSNKNLLPVMVFIHGGGYYFGKNDDGTYNPKYLVQKNVIVVTITYRLGAFGFLCLNTKEAPGNIGLKDQVAALQWVKSNIKIFGGNPDEITVFGQSVGAASIHYLIVTGAYKGLFSKAILQSGSVLMPTMYTENPMKSALLVASRMGFTTSDPEEILKVFQNATASKIVEASHINRKNNPLAVNLFVPCKEYERPDYKILITKKPRQMLEEFDLSDNNLRIIIGFNNMEGIYYADEYDNNGLIKLNENFVNSIPKNLKFQNTTQMIAVANSIKKFYFDKYNITSINTEGLINLFTDSMVNYPSIASTFSFISSNVSIYNYFFKYDSFRNLVKLASSLSSYPGADHGDELFYMFDPAECNDIIPTANDMRMIDTLTNLWTTFAKTGYPSTETANVNWIQNEDENLNFLQLDNDIQIISLPNPERFQFWDKIYKKYSAF